MTDPRVHRSPESGGPHAGDDPVDPPGQPTAGQKDLPATPQPTPSPEPGAASNQLSLDRSAVERVLARAAELQSSGSDAVGQLSESQLLEVGHEVGLSTASLRQAIAEERTRVALPEGRGWAGELFGPATAGASRTITGSRSRTMGLLEQLMINDEFMTVKRRFPDRTTWEPRRDIWAGLRRSFNPNGRGYALTVTHEVAATVVPVDDTRVLVRMDADLRSTRRTRLQLGGAAAGTGLATGTAIAIVGAMVAIPTAAAMAAVATVAALPVLAGVGGGYAIARQHRGTAVRVQLALEQLLDRLEHGPGRSSASPFIERLLR